MSKVKIIPDLRFPEFEKNGEWVETTIEQVAKVTTGNKDTQNKVENGKYPFFVRSQTVERINSYSFDGEAILTSGDGVGVGKNFHYINGKFDFHQRVYCIYDFLNDVCGEFVFMFFSQHFNERVMKMSAKNSVDSVRMAMITEMPICLPSKNEQQKIASCLSSLDEVIAAHSQKLDLLKNHKKGLMQNLFPSQMALNSRSELEEERRLFYVALTRGMRSCMLYYATSRFTWGQSIMCEPSRFIDEIDPQYLQFE